MRSNSYRDIMRYLQVVAPAVKITPNYFVVKDITIVPHDSASLFPSKLPVRADIVQKISQRSVYYGVSHADGEMYVQALPELKKYIGAELIDGNYLVPTEQFQKLKDVLPYPDAGKFVHAHLHSMYSALDGMSDTDTIARRCKQLGMPAVALTDHGTMAGVIDFYKACKKYGIKPIIGQEFYVDDDRFQKGVPDDVKKEHKKTKEGKALNRMWEKEHRVNQRRHLVLLAKSNEGLRNLYRLSSLGYIEGFYYRPRIDWELLERYKKGIIVTTACAAGYLGEKETPKYRAHFLKKLVGIFGKDNLYLEIMLHDYEKQPELNDFVIDVHEKTGIPMICTVDAHYIDPDPNHIHQLYLRIGAGYEYGGGHNYIKSWGELRETHSQFFSRAKHGWDKYSKALSTTLQLADRCNVEIELGKFKMPQFDLSAAVVPANPGETDVNYLVRRAKEGFRERVSAVIPKAEQGVYLDRLKYELKTFIDAGYVNYTLIVLDMIDYAKSNGRLVVVRGSAAGSLLCYCLKMTSVDPIKNKLLFERFVSPLRAGLVDKSYQSPPDIDVDYPNRDEMIQYAAQKYGEDCVARIGTCNRMQVRQSIKSMAEATQFMSFSDANRVTKTIPDSSKTLEEAIEMSLSFKDWYAQKRHKEWIDTYVDSVIGIAGHHSIHAAGIVIAPGKIIDYLPVQVQEKKKEDEKSQGQARVMTTQLEGDSIEEIGLLKFDVLRVRTLAHLKRTQELIYERRGKMIDFNKIDLDNPKYFKGFQNKDTQGVFQMDTKATSNLLNHTTIRCFDDVVAVVSLSRPGTAGPGLDIEYCERKKGKPFEYDHPLLKPVLKDTYGIPIFQEQIMQMVHVLGGMTLVEADKFRKMMKKKDVAQMGSYRERFLAGAIERGVKNREEAMKIWEKIVSWSSYGFCVAGDTVVTRSSGNQHQPKEVTIEWLYNAMRSNTDVGDKYRRRGYPEIMSKQGDAIRPMKIKDIYRTGRKVLYRVLLDDGKYIDATEEHRILTKRGYIEVADMRPQDDLVVTMGERIYRPKKGLQCDRARGKKYDGIVGGKGFRKGEKNPSYVDGRTRLFESNSLKKREKVFHCEHCGAPANKDHEVHHNKLLHELDYDYARYHALKNLLLLCSSCHKKEHYKRGRSKRHALGKPVVWRSVVSIKKLGVKDVYDIEMKGRYPNFVGNGIVVHNCKAHATAYAQLSVWTMVMKQLFPLEFYIGWLENPKNKDQLIMIYRDMIKHNISVVFPNVNQSKTRFYINDSNEIVWALKGIKYVGQPVAQAIADNAPYSSMKEFVEKTKDHRVTKRSIDPLICINAFPWCDSPKQAANEYYKYREEPVPAHFLSDDKKYWNRRFHEFTGYYREDPLDIYAKELQEYGKLDSLDEFKELQCGMPTKLAGYVTDYRSLDSKRGKMAIFSVEVELQDVKIVAWNSFYKNSILDGLEPSEVIGRFVFVFGDRDIDDRNVDQVQLGNPNNDKLEIID